MVVLVLVGDSHRAIARNIELRNGTRFLAEGPRMVATTFTAFLVLVPGIPFLPNAFTTIFGPPQGCVCRAALQYIRRFPRNPNGVTVNSQGWQTPGTRPPPMVEAPTGRRNLSEPATRENLGIVPVFWKDE